MIVLVAHFNYHENIILFGSQIRSVAGFVEALTGNIVHSTDTKDLFSIDPGKGSEEMDDRIGTASCLQLHKGTAGPIECRKPGSPAGVPAPITWRGREQFPDRQEEEKVQDVKKERTFAKDLQWIVLSGPEMSGPGER